MNPIVTVLYKNSRGEYRLEEQACTTVMTSVKPEDFGLDHDCEIIAVFHQLRATAVFVRGDRKA